MIDIDSNTKFEPTMVWNADDVFKTMENYINKLLDRISELENKIVELNVEFNDEIIELQTYND